MKNIITLTIYIFSIITLAQNYKVQINDNELVLHNDFSIEGRLNLTTENATVGAFRFEDGQVITSDSIIANYDRTKLFIDDRTYKFKTPAFSLTNMVVDKTSRKSKVFELFQESQNILQLNSEITLNDKNYDVLKSWALFKQMIDMKESKNIDITMPILIGVVAGILTTSN
ncbi:hypothetical protein BST97_12180 [Nonlabens spongiae]|uniref:Uncharacterized protein n=1 Tax=Nonlabens spongiae TaxID=331648 RepID=A0A1W6MM90_9FLAO|nr:hypothetical protein [Nonlabens spongiae]ARN78687.1 hypothetical protein BST97_12180 [Nonlabens spongiae]